MSAERQDQERKDVTEDLELSEDEAGGVKGGTIPIEGGDTGSSYTLSSKKKKKKKKQQIGPYQGKH